MRVVTILPLILVLAGSSCGSSRSVGGDATVDSGLDAAVAESGLPDSSTPDLAPGDLAPETDMTLSFPAVLEGVWLIGWQGGMDHFSWVRFAAMPSRTPNKKDAWILDGKDIVGNLPLLSCSGKTTYWMGAAFNTIYLDLPSPSCDPGSTSAAWVFDSFTAPGANSPAGAILVAAIKEQASLKSLAGIKFPGDWCDAAMTSCKAPF